MRVTLALTLLAACGPGAIEAELFDGQYTASAKLAEISTLRGAASATQAADDWGVWADAVLDIDGDDLTLTAEDIVLHGTIERQPENRWKRMCQGAHYTLNPGQLTRAEWFDAALDEDVALPAIPSEVFGLRVEGQASCGDAQVPNIDLTVLGYSGLVWSIVQLRLDEPEP